MSDAYTDIAKQTKETLKRMQNETATANPQPHPELCIHVKVCRGVVRAISEIPGKLAALKCEDGDECVFFSPNSSSDSDKVLDKAKAKLDGYYKSLPVHHPYLDGIDLSIQKIEELQEELRQEREP